MAYGDIDAGMTEAEKQHLAELTATCEKQSTRIAGLEGGVADLERLLNEETAISGRWFFWHMKAAGEDNEVIEGLTERAETAEAELAKLRKSKDICSVCLTWSWAPCDEGDEGAEQRGEEWVLCQCCNDSRIAVLWKGRAEKLRDYAGHKSGCPGMNWQRHQVRGCLCGWAQTEAALGEGGGA